MEIAVIGLGSMGKRRIRLIREMYPDYSVVGIDGKDERRKESEELFKIVTHSSTSEISEPIKCAFVCTSPLSHSEIINDCLKRGWNVFTELNLVENGYDENIKLSRGKNLVLFMSSTFLYRDEIKYIKSKVTNDKKWNYIYHIGQYLPDWHPWESYKDFFIGDKRTNGCREIMAIELPWLVDTFGKITDFNLMSDRMTGLNIDFNDNFIIQFMHESGNKGVLMVDVVSPIAIRKLEVYSEGDYISWNGTPESLVAFDSGSNSIKAVKFDEKTEHVEGYRSFVVENAYKNEIREFFDVVLLGKSPTYGFEQDRLILNMISTLGA